MTRLTTLFLFTTLFAVTTTILLGFSLINEAARSSAYSEQSYKNGLIDGEQFTRDRLKRDAAMSELIEEAQHVAEEKL